jgi:type I restriction enzyme S subunit
LLRNKRGATKIGLGLDDIRGTPVPEISNDNAIKIVSAIESRFSICDQLEHIVDESLAKADALRQSILKKAFDGKLVFQDPTDEPAEKLLERIKAEQKAGKNTTKKDKGYEKRR